VPVTPLSDQDRKFCQNFLLGMTATQAAKAAGYLNPENDGKNLIARVEVQQLIAAEQAAYRDASGVSRKAVTDGMLEAIDMARTMADPQTMLIGYRELAKMHGYYAPEVRRVQVDVNGTVQVQHLERLSDAELLKLMDAPPVYEGESQPVEETTNA
jgi:phage terminase small subunit